jgi:hypothetical protein
MGRFVGWGCMLLVTVALSVIGLTHNRLEVTPEAFIRLIDEVPLGTSRENVVGFLDQHKAFFDEHGVVVSSRPRFPNEFVHVVLVKHERLGWYPSLQADYEFKDNKLIRIQFRELHLL